MVAGQRGRRRCTSDAERMWKGRVTSHHDSWRLEVTTHVQKPQGSRQVASGDQRPNAIDKLGVTGSSPVPPTPQKPCYGGAIFRV
jgi:hypothetical protein